MMVMFAGAAVAVIGAGRPHGSQAPGPRDTISELVKSLRSNQEETRVKAIEEFARHWDPGGFLPLPDDAHLALAARSLVEALLGDGRLPVQKAAAGSLIRM